MESSAHLYFAANENKRMLWKLLGNGSIFNGIPDEHVSTIRRDFEKKILELTERVATSGYSLIELNKTFISEMIGDLESFKNKASSVQNAFEKKKDDFNSLIAIKPPDKIDFSDKMDKAIDESNTETILAETIARRERELNFVLEKQQTQIKPDNTRSSSSSIKIGDSLEQGRVLNVKHVRFSDKVETREHENFTDNEVVVANEVVANEVSTKKYDDLNDSHLFITKRDYHTLIEKLDGASMKYKRDVIDIINEALKINPSVA